MDILAWALIIILFVIAFIGLIYPIIPSVLFIAAGFIVYGLFYSFEPFGVLFWSIQILFVILLFGADYISNMVGVKKYGGTKAGIWGSTIGILVGPFVIPVAGILLGPIVGAIIAELIVHRRPFKEAVLVGFGSLVGFISSIITKGIVQVVMIIYFLFVVL
ncbi:DUF456 family protein [Cytobacillus sp. FSL W7-1323]|uniref:DUF456 domain-containing protein n=1 Tax=Cytobacillus kochii TaxID=859143 RepID=A0A248TLI9_9BACI|nr:MULTISPECIES: DUF456 family protein [Cytobacillus]ASV68989.1 hypothetical protein CKF48_17810 [Cytobacillus kochii]MCM3320574.1 DUF456 family protein [Cytobacillus kochii]MCM3344592.1 DUF456 family protein [Cytobacillus kochii]MDQ0183716.1 uncharacterized protein YqgC (DUF456 family) [Cytobacillus kochii]MEA1853111.1 DUF456 family protein [Cytobacillus sp. OWB-43]